MRTCGPYLEDKLQSAARTACWATTSCGKEGFNFDIRIQMGAGAYICGEETALISSCEGLRGDPKNRPPFPAQKGYLGRRRSVNNVETLCCVTKILETGPAAVPSTAREQQRDEAAEHLGRLPAAGHLRGRASARRCARC
jgi:NADH:ubiquinone oxidoreductase subunit F (NADH-binding)